MSFITGTFVMEVRDEAHGEDIVEILDEIQEKYKLNVLKWSEGK